MYRTPRSRKASVTMFISASVAVVCLVILFVNKESDFTREVLTIVFLASLVVLRLAAGPRRRRLSDGTETPPEQRRR